MKGQSLRCSPCWGNAGPCAVRCAAVCGGGAWEGAMVLAPVSAGFQSLPPLPTIKLGSSGADSQVGGLVHALGPCGSLQQPLLWGWEFLLLPTQPRVFAIRCLRLYFLRWSPGLHGPLHFPAVPPGLSVRECGVAGSASGRTACPVHSTIHQSLGLAPLPRVPSTLASHLCPSYQSGWMFLPYLLGCQTSVWFDFCQLWLFFVLKLLLSFFWLCEEAQCVYLRLHLGFSAHIVLLQNKYLGLNSN